MKINAQITSPRVRVLDSKGKQLGVFAIAEALALAKAQGLDLIEIAPTAKPPVCRLMDYAAFRYEEKRRAKSDGGPRVKGDEPPSDAGLGFAE